MSSKLAIALLLALVAVGVAAFLLTHEKVSDTTYTGFRGEARINRFLAAELLLREVGVEADSLETLEPLDWLPDYGDTIFTRASATHAVSGPRDLLIDWTSSGGHLIILLPYQPDPLTYDLLARFDVAVVELDEPPQSLDEGESGNGEQFDYILDLEAAYQRLTLVNEKAFISTLSDNAGIVAARRTFGDGYVTVVAEDSFFGNRDLAQEDHARLLLDIVAGYVDPGKVWFVYDASFTPLWRLIWNNAPFAVLGLLLCLIVSMWAVMPAFGPVIMEQRSSRRSIIEHIRAAGTFVWKLRGASKLGEGAANALLHRAEAKHPGISRQSPANQAKLIARMTDLDAQSILDAISNGAQPHAREFTQHMKMLQRIRKKI